jgi:hypothetical protein
MMKWILLLLVIPCISLSQTKLYVSYGHATTSWITVTKASTAPYIKIRSFTVYSDSTAGDTLWVAFNADTTAGMMFPVLHGTSKNFPSVYLNTVMLKAGGGNLPYRIDLQ